MFPHYIGCIGALDASSAPTTRTGFGSCNLTLTETTMRGAPTFSTVARTLTKNATTYGLAGALLLGVLVMSLSGCVAYDPYPPQPVYYQPAPYYVAPSPSYYYYRPCCATYFDFGYSSRNDGHRGSNRREWRDHDRNGSDHHGHY